MELIISTAYMALASVVCVRLYLYAHTMSADSAARTHAMTQAQNMVVSFREGDGTLADAAWKYQEAAEKYPGVLNEIRTIAGSADASSISQLTFSYDADWYLTGAAGAGTTPEDAMTVSGSAQSADAAYRMVVSLSDSADTPGMKILKITVSDEQSGSGRSVYSTEYDEYVPDFLSEAGKEASG